MTAIGETLRRERLKKNLGLEQISRELKISQKFLEAIEDEDFEKIPHGVFAKSFVRQYARMLGLDEEEMAAQVQRVMAPPPSLQQIAEADKTRSEDIKMSPVETWQTTGEGRPWSSALPAFAGVVVVMLICSGLYAWWQRERTPVAARQAAVEAPVPAPAPPVETSQAPAAQPDKPAEPVQAAPAPTGATATTPAQTADATQTPAATGNSPVRVQVTADEAVWVLARADDKYLFSGTLEANQSRTVEANDKVLLRIGNAGGVSITLNGKPVGAVGPKGQVRTVQFTSGGFQIVAAPKPSLPLDDMF